MTAVRDPPAVSSSTDVVKSIYAALERGEIDAAMDLFSPEASFEGPNGFGLAPVAGSDSVRRDLVRGHFTRLHEAFDQFHFVVEEMWNGDEHVVARLRLGGRGKSGASSWALAYHEHTVQDGQSVGLRVLESFDPTTGQSIP